jgi:hypothetical protein
MQPVNKLVVSDLDIKCKGTVRKWSNLLAIACCVLFVVTHVLIHWLVDIVLENKINDCSENN